MLDAQTQHSLEIAETKDCWERKPLLRAAYRSFHNEIKECLVQEDGLTVELGSGIGMIKETIPDCITTDIFENPLVDRVEDAYTLNFTDRSIANLILFDVWHHLEYPGTAMKEFHRVLQDGGRIILFEPAALSLLGKMVFGCFHHEPIHADHPQEYYIPEHMKVDELEYFAAQGNAWKFFYRGDFPDELKNLWSRPEVQFFPAFEWLAAGGFRQRQLAPKALLPVFRGASKIASLLPSVFATRMLIVLDKQEPSPQ